MRYLKNKTKKTKTKSKTSFFFIVSQPFSYFLQHWLKQNWRYYILDATSQDDACYLVNGDKDGKWLNNNPLCIALHIWTPQHYYPEQFNSSVLSRPVEDKINCILSFSPSLSLSLSLSLLDAGLFIDFD